MNTSYIHVDPQTCIGCRTCEASCAVNHQTDQYQAFHPRLRVYKNAKESAPALCHQCETAPCLNACPASALQKKHGIIEPTNALCIGCKSCIVACPFGAIEITHDPHFPQNMFILKCDMCQGDPRGPACVRTCPTKALSIMTTERLLHLNQQRRSSLLLAKMWVT